MSLTSGVEPCRVLALVEDLWADVPVVQCAGAVASARSGELRLVYAEGPTRPEPDVERERERQLRALAEQSGAAGFARVHTPSGGANALRAFSTYWRPDLLAVGWDGCPAYLRVAAEQNVDCMVLKSWTRPPFRRIGVLTSGGAHALLGVVVARDLAAAWGSTAQVLRVVRRSSSPSSESAARRYRQQCLQRVRLQLQLAGISLPLRLVVAEDIVEAIASRASRFDLLIMGASSDWRMQEHLGGSIPEQVASRIPCSLLVNRTCDIDYADLKNVFWEDTIRLGVCCRDKWEAIRYVVNLLVDEKQVPESRREEILESVKRREMEMSTCLGEGIAVTHAAVADLRGMVGGLAICPKGVPFGDFPGQLVHFVFLLLSPASNQRLYLRTLARIARMLCRPELRESLLQCQTAAEAAQLFRDEPPAHGEFSNETH